jgi:hypothetical protein
MGDKLIQSYGKSLTRQALYSIVLGGILVICLGCLLVGLAIVPEEIISSEVKPFILVGLLIVFFAFAIGGTLFWVLSRNRQFSRRLDAAFATLGLTGSRYLVSGRQYQGTVGGRKMNVYYRLSGGRSFRTPDLTIYLDGKFHTRLGIGSKNVLTSAGGALTGQNHLELNEPLYEGLLIYPLDETWSLSLLTDPEAQKSVVRLVGKDTPGTRGVVFAPQSIKLQIRHFNAELITPEAVRAWVDDLMRLAEIAEALSPPTKTAQASDLELASQANRAKFTPFALGLVALLIICPVLLVGGVFLALFLLEVFP